MTARINMRERIKTGLALLTALTVAAGAHAECSASTSALDSMETTELTLSGPDNRSITLQARVADDNRERAGGFQYICPDAIAGTAIYFEFDHPRRPSFHMHNVEAPLDIAFVDAGGLIIDIQTMEPYVLGATRYKYYSPPGPVTAALETRAGYFSERRITAGTWKIELPR